LHHPGEVTAFPRGKRGGPPLRQQSPTNRGFSRVDACRFHPHEDAAGADDRRAELHDLQDVDVTVLIEPHCLHAGSLLPRRGLRMSAAAREALKSEVRVGSVRIPRTGPEAIYRLQNLRHPTWMVYPTPDRHTRASSGECIGKD